jgi:hypothetical protein
MAAQLNTFFRVRGTVSRKPYVGAKVAFLPVAVEAGQRKTYFDVKAFAGDLLDVIGGLKEGDAVTIDGELMTEEVRVDKEVIKDARGKAVYAVALKATKITAGHAQSQAQQTRRDPRLSQPPPATSEEVPEL